MEMDIKSTEYVAVDALKHHIDVIRDYYQDIKDVCMRHGNSSGEYVYQGFLEALNELNDKIDEMKVSL